MPPTSPLTHPNHTHQHASTLNQVMHNFLPSAVKFHYQFNLREMSNVVGGLCRMTKNEFREPMQVRWVGLLS